MNDSGLYIFSIITQFIDKDKTDIFTTYCLFTCIFIRVQHIIALTVPFMNALHIGHFRNAGAQLTQAAMCPQGRKTMATSSSRHILQVW